MNAEFQRTERRDKKAFLSDQCKETEENNKMGKTGDSSRDRDTKGIFHVKMGLIKDRKGMDLTEADDIKKRWQEYTEELYKKDFHDTDNHSPRARHPGMRSQVGLRKHHYEQSYTPSAFKKQKHYFAGKGPYSQSYGFSSHVCM